MYTGGGERLIEPDERNRGLGASIRRSVGDGAVVGFSFGATEAESGNRAAMFSLTLPLSRGREPAPSEQLGWRSFLSTRAAAYAPFEPLNRRLLDLRLPEVDVLPYRDPEAVDPGQIGLELLAPVPPLL